MTERITISGPEHNVSLQVEPPGENGDRHVAFSFVGKVSQARWRSLISAFGEELAEEFAAPYEPAPEDGQEAQEAQEQALDEADYLIWYAFSLFGLTHVSFAEDNLTTLKQTARFRDFQQRAVAWRARHSTRSLAEDASENIEGIFD